MANIDIEAELASIITDIKAIKAASDKVQGLNYRVMSKAYKLWIYCNDVRGLAAVSNLDEFSRKDFRNALKAVQIMSCNSLDLDARTYDKNSFILTMFKGAIICTTLSDPDFQSLRDRWNWLPKEAKGREVQWILDNFSANKTKPQNGLVKLLAELDEYRSAVKAYRANGKSLKGLPTAAVRSKAKTAIESGLDLDKLFPEK